jgi:hypothetical protein
MQMLQCNANTMMQCNAMQCNAMHDFTFTHKSQGEEVRDAITLLINVRCCTGTYRTNLATVSSNAYQRKECKCKSCHVSTSYAS